MSPPVEPRPAATVMLVRDTGGGMEVFMVRRTLNADFVGGAYVFPGGSVDPADRDPGIEDWSTGRSDAEASSALDVDEGGLALWVAAVRECFEEAGVLLADRADGRQLDLKDPDEAARFADHRRAVAAGERSMIEVCRQEAVRLALGDIHYFSHWITPEGSHRRFDTRFFVARAPSGQEPLHDGGELIDQTWIRPADALDRHRRGEFDLILPTIRNLQALARFKLADDLIEAARARTDVPTMMPRLVRDGGGVRILLPGDPGYDAAGEEPAMALTPSMPMPGRPGGPSIVEGEHE
jgi:8-oxo-dGTP pyrophosphatase MutT (NUDIX family)